MTKNKEYYERIEDIPFIENYLALYAAIVKPDGNAANTVKYMYPEDRFDYKQWYNNNKERAK